MHAHSPHLALVSLIVIIRAIPAFTATAQPIFSNLGVSSAVFDARTPDSSGAIIAVGASLYAVNATGAVTPLGPVRTSVSGSSSQFVLGSLVFAGANGRQCSGA